LKPYILLHQKNLLKLAWVPACAGMTVVGAKAARLLSTSSRC